LWVALSACYAVAILIFAWNAWPQLADVSEGQVFEKLPVDMAILASPRLDKTGGVYINCND
jgi:hypothetical protein